MSIKAYYCAGMWYLWIPHIPETCCVVVDVFSRSDGKFGKLFLISQLAVQVFVVLVLKRGAAPAN